MNWLEMVLKYLPAALQIIAVIQATIPAAPGPVKKAVAIAAIAPAEADKPHVGTLVDNLVAALVSGGAFVKDAAPHVVLVTPPVKAA